MNLRYLPFHEHIGWDRIRSTGLLDGKETARFTDGMCSSSQGAITKQPRRRDCSIIENLCLQCRDLRLHGMCRKFHSLPDPAGRSAPTKYHNCWTFSADKIPQLCLPTVLNPRQRIVRKFYFLMSECWIISIPCIHVQLRRKPCV